MNKIGVFVVFYFIGYPAQAEHYLNLRPQHTAPQETTRGLGSLGYGLNTQEYPSYLYPTTPHSGYGPSNGFYPRSNFPLWPYYAY